MGREGGGLHALLVCSPPGLGLEFVFVEIGLGQSVVSPGDKGRLATREVASPGPGFPGCDANPQSGFHLPGPPVWPHGTQRARDTNANHMVCARFARAPNSRRGALGLRSLQGAVTG